ncbi:amino acid transporter [Reticulomyxa filosa]|uniref:Amino acid transporter n=1 Tax=Reticulomyxa filosa TaxID=46433 RepID=X6NCX1_RETFI|nr:amino acid transporter [Reticulomyxa filosa]|eukprot:ETO23743.1 amino acid transporter [Reticulomyxa filosa]
MYKKAFGQHLHHTIVWGLKALFVLLAGILNLMNISVQGTASIICSTILMLPFFIGFFYSLPNTDFHTWVKGAPNGSVNWAIYVSTLIWFVCFSVRFFFMCMHVYNMRYYLVWFYCVMVFDKCNDQIRLHTGRDVMGCVAGEAGFAPKDFIKCFIISIVMDWVGYTLPLIGAFTVPYDGSAWQNGYLITAYNDIIPGLQWFVICGALFSCFSLYFMEFCAHVRMMWAISQKYIIISPDGQLYLKDEYKKVLKELEDAKSASRSLVSAATKNSTSTPMSTGNNTLGVSIGPASASFAQDGPDDSSGLMKTNASSSFRADFAEATQRIGPVKANRYIRVQIFPEWVGWEWERTGSPAVAVVIQTTINMVLVGLPFDNLLIVSTVIGCFTYLTEFTAFIVLKYNEPDAVRPYTVPGGLWGAWAVTVTKVGLVFTVFGMTIYDYPWMFLWCVLYDVFLIGLFYFRKYFFPDDNPYIQLEKNAQKAV